MRLSSATIAASAAVLGWAVPAVADTATAVSCEARVGAGFRACAGNGGFSSDAGTYQPGTTRTASGSDALSQYDTVASARADYGALGVAGSASGSGGQPRVNTSASAAWTDAFTILSSTLAAGSSVSIRVTQIIDVHSLSATAGGRYPSTGTKLSFYSSLVNTGIVFANACTSFGIDAFGNTSQDDQCRTPTLLHVGRNIITSEFVLAVGDTRTFSAQLDGSAVYYNSFSAPNGTGAAGFDAFNTAHSYFAVLTPGAIFRTVSGQGYAAPALPEPASWALLLIGFAGVGTRLRRQRRRVA